MTTRDYEGLFILKTAGTEQEVAQHASALEEPIRKLGGQITGANSLGRRRLAYRISRQVEGFYHVVRLNAPTECVKELDRLFRLNERIIRFIILTQEEAGTASATEAPAAEATVSARS